MLILHLSDLHFGKHNRFAGQDPADLAKSFHQDLAAALQEWEAKGRVEVVVVTGDVAEEGKPAELEQGRVFLTTLAGELGIGTRRFVIVPGNHDVSWAACRREVESQELEGFDEPELRRRIDFEKLGLFRKFLSNFYGEDVATFSRTLARGARIHDFPELLLSVAALDSCEKESHLAGDHVGHVSREQAQAVLDAWKDGEAAWLRIIAVHHNPATTTPQNVEEWRRLLLKKGRIGRELMTRYESDVVGFDEDRYLRQIGNEANVHLVLHGHHHAQDEVSWNGGRTHVVSAGSLCLATDQLPKEEPLSFRIFGIQRDAPETQVWSLVFAPRWRAKGRIGSGAFVPSRPSVPLQLVLAESTAGRHLPHEGLRLGEVGDAVSEDFLRTYRRRLAHAYETWDLAGVGVVLPGGVGRTIEARLDDMYVELRLNQGFDATNTEVGRDLAPERLRGRRRPLAIRGGAGSGKTTWMRRTFRGLLQRDDSLPLMLVLRDLARRWSNPGCVGAARSLDAFLDAEAASRLGSGWEGSVRKALAARQGPRPVLLVDGWDELGPLGEEMREKLLGLMTEHSRLLVVVTSRPYGTGNPSSGADFEVLDIQPLANGEVADLAYRFFRYCYGQDELEARRGVDRFTSALAASPDARVLSRTALHLTMMLLLSRSGPLPDKRHLLYSACLEGLLSARPRQKEAEGAVLGHEQWRPPDGEERLKAVAALAAGLQRKGYQSRLRSPTVAGWDEMADLLPNVWKAGERNGFLAWLAGPAAVLTDRADGTLAFTHLSFQEFLTAWHFNAPIEGAEDRREGFRAHRGDYAWWETLLLWAALIQKQNTAFLAAVIIDLLNDHDRGLYLAGIVLADGLGTEMQIGPWVAGLLVDLAWRWPPALDRALRAWAASHQDDRRRDIHSRLTTAAPGFHWHLWVRAEFVSRVGGFGEALPPPRPGSLAAAVLVPVEPQVDGRWLAAGRVVAGVAPLWPPAGLSGLLSLWPSTRRIAGNRVQLAVTVGATRRAVLTLLRGFRTRREKPPESRDSAPYFAWSFARDFARDSARYSTRYLAPDFVPDFAQHFAQSFARDCVRDFSQYFSRHSARDFARAFARDLVLDFPCLFARGFARDLAQKHDISELEPWVRAFAVLELASVGRATGRSVLAHAANLPDMAELGLLATACRLSLHPGSDARTFEDALLRTGPNLDPLWPALARHLARRSTDADRDLLRDLAAHPEKREPPLRWGLQYIVRGDVLFEDGIETTLDELCAEAGVEPFPLLEEMPDEIELPDVG